MRPSRPLLPAPFELLVLDAGGLLVSNQLLALFAELARAAGVSVHRVHALHHQLRHRLWCGQINEPTFWSTMFESLGLAHDPDRWRARMGHLLGPGIPARTLERWSGHIPVWLLSNHRSEWLLPALERHGLTRHLERVVVSDIVGVAKPDPAIYELVEARAGHAPQRLLFVDDRPRNLRPARHRGWHTIRADRHGRWTGTVDRLLTAGYEPLPPVADQRGAETAEPVVPTTSTQLQPPHAVT